MTKTTLETPGKNHSTCQWLEGRKGFLLKHAVLCSDDGLLHALSANTEEICSEVILQETSSAICLYQLALSTMSAFVIRIQTQFS